MILTLLTVIVRVVNFRKVSREGEGGGTNGLGNACNVNQILFQQTIQNQQQIINEIHIF